jgi:hypothetical protein
MGRAGVVPSNQRHNASRLVLTVVAVLLLPLVLAVLAVPIVLLLVPAAWLAIPFVVITMLNRVLAALALEFRRAVRKPAHRALLVPVY